MINKPAPAAPAPSAGGRAPTDYQTMHDQWSDMPPPNPAGLIQLLMTPGFLTKHQMDAIKALLTSPGTPAGGPTQAPQAAPPAANPLGGGQAG